VAKSKDIWSSRGFQGWNVLCWTSH